MHKPSTYNFDYSYLTLPNIFYSVVKPTSIIKPEIVLVNHDLSAKLDISFQNMVDLDLLLYGSNINNLERSYAQAYAGHQFGYFTKLGDGRAIVIGEHITSKNERFDVQIKGSGKTIYSRGGDGKATLKSILREYLMSEAMHYLNIPSSRSLAVFKTGDVVIRDAIQEGAVLTRVMKSHLRIGTFEYASQFGSIDDLKAITNYTIRRLFPHIEFDENPVISFLNSVMKLQIDLVVNWMRVGFIHGVMNTDNTSISGETFDYGPCAFINTYHPNTVYSSIDLNGRYAFGNQPEIIKWNIARFAEALLPIIHENKEKSIELAQNVIDGFDACWKERYYGMMLNKIGIESNNSKLYMLVDELLELMNNLKLDYTNTFFALSQDIYSTDNPNNTIEFNNWLKKWRYTIDNSNGMQQALILMHANNPVFIPRNHLVEQALEDAVKGNFSLFENLLRVWSKPYLLQPNDRLFMMQSDLDFEKNYQTFCGT